MAAGCAPFFTFAGPSLPLRLEKKPGILRVESAIIRMGVCGCNAFDIDLPVGSRNSYAKIQGAIRASTGDGIC